MNAKIYNLSEAYIFLVLVFEDATTSAVPSTAMIASTSGTPACQVLLWETELSPSLLFLLPPLLYCLLSQEADPNADFVLGVLVKLGSKCSHLLSLVLQSLKRGVHFCFFHLSDRKNDDPSVVKIWFGPYFSLDQSLFWCSHNYR